MTNSVTATILFTDLVGSTELLTSVGDARFDLLRREHTELLTTSIAESGGRVVKNLGDGLMAVFPSAAAGAQAAVAIQQVVDSANRRPSAVAVGVRVGLSAGDCIEEDGDYFGTVVVEAARLCGRAAGGQILAAAIVPRLIGTTHDLDVGDAFPLDLKGIPEPVRTCEIDWASQAAPLPARLSAHDEVDHAFVGRVAELEQVRTAVSDGLAGETRCVLVGGETGIGKTRLVARVAIEENRRGALVLYGRADVEIGAAYRPFTEALAQVVAVASDDLLAVHVATHGAAVLALVPSLRGRLPDVEVPELDETEAGRYRLFQAIGGLLAAMAETTPVLLVLDDLHWAGEPSLLLLRHLLYDTRPRSCCIVGTYRDTDVTSTDALGRLLADLTRESWAGRIVLDGLVGDDVAAYLGAATGARQAGSTLSVADAVLEQTRGNPLFVCEVIGNLIESGAEVDELGQLRVPPLDDAAPDSVVELVTRRVELLGVEAAELLRVASVIAPEFSVDLLAVVTEVRVDDLLEVLDAAVAGRLLHERVDAFGRYQFANPVVRDALQSGLGAGRRVRLHRRIAEALEEQSSATVSVGLLAHHYGASLALGGADRAVRYALAAAEEAMAVLAFEQAARHYERAVAALEVLEPHDAAQLCEALLRWGTARNLTGETETARACFRRAAELARDGRWPVQLARAALGLGGEFNPYGSLTHDPEQVALLREALDVLPVDEAFAVRRAELLADLALGLHHEEPASVWAPLVDEARDLADTVADRTDRHAALATVLSRRHPLFHGPDGLTDRLATARRIVDLGTAGENPDLQLQGWEWMLVDALEAADVPLFGEALSQRDGLVERLQRPAYRWSRALTDAMRATIEGRFSDADRLAWRALSLGQPAVGEDAIRFFAIQMFRLQHFRGRVGPLLDTAEAFWEMHRDYVAAGAIVLQGRVAVGRHDAARPLLDELTATGLDTLRRDFDWFPAMCHLGFSAAELGADDVAREIHTRLGPFRYRASTSGAAVLWASVSHLLGVLGRRLGEAGAADDLATAERFYEELGARPYLAELHWEQARLARDAGDTATAEALGSAALDAARELGMGSLVDEVEAGR